MLNIKELKYFQAVVDTGSITSGAKRLKIKQPPLSRAIHSLEAKLKSKLFIRRRNGIELTEAGEHLYSELDKIFNLIANTEKDIYQIGQGKKGTITIGYIPSGVRSILDEILTKITLHQPEVIINLRESQSGFLIKELRDHTIDLAITKSTINLEGLVVVKELKETFSLISAINKSPAGLSVENSTKRLEEQGFIHFERKLGAELYDQILRICNKLSFKPRIVITANSVRSIIDLVEMGFGNAIVPTPLVKSRTDTINVQELGKECGLSSTYLLAREKQSPLIQNILDEL